MIGALNGAIFSGCVIHRLGSKKLLIIADCIAIIGAIISLTLTLASLILGRFI